MTGPLLFVKDNDDRLVLSTLREYVEWGYKTLDLAGPPRKFWADEEMQEPPVETGVDFRSVRPIPSPSDLLRSIPPEENWQSISRRSINRLHAFFLVCEDPQRRMDVREVDTLSHQISLVQHILQSERLNRVLIADEVGLGKTVEVGLILQSLFSQRPGLRVLYLAPARLVSNVRREFDRLNLGFRQWSATDGDAILSDSRIIASIHRAVHGNNSERVLATNPWDVIIVDECHHLSAWSPDAGDPTQAYKLVRDLTGRQSEGSRLILMSGTPHQGHISRFDNLLKLLRDRSDAAANDTLNGRVIYRTKDDIRDWEDNPVFPPRQVNPPTLVDLGPKHRNWIRNIHDYYSPSAHADGVGESRRRAAGWRCAQALQWAASSPQAGLGYLSRQAIRAGWASSDPTLRKALSELRPYRLGPIDEPVDQLFDRMKKEVERQKRDADLDDVEEYGDSEEAAVERMGLQALLEEGIEIVRTSGDEKWKLIERELLRPAGDEKVVLFAQPIETVTSLARFLEVRMGRRPALIMGGQTDEERRKEVESFWRADGPQYLVSSRAGGEGINLQVARRLIHIDVPWNPMDLEQRVGRIHRFGSRETVIVDTLIVKDSREADAYRIARDKLKLIASTLVEKEKFESVFSRVMCLLPQEKLQEIILNAPEAPFDQRDEYSLSKMIQEGFNAWKDFHDRYGEQQQTIESQDPGLLTWEDVAFFFETLGGAQRVPGFRKHRFERQGDRVERVEEEVTVLRLGDGSNLVCGDIGEALVFGPDDTPTARLGLNLPQAADLLRKYAFPAQPCGPAHLRWPAGISKPTSLGRLPTGVLVLLRQSYRDDRHGGWTESEASLKCFVVGADATTTVEGDEAGQLLRGLLRAVVKKAPDLDEALVKAMAEAEESLVNELRPPTEAEFKAQIRHAVVPLLAAIVSD